MPVVMAKFQRARAPPMSPGGALLSPPRCPGEMTVTMLTRRPYSSQIHTAGPRPPSCPMTKAAPGSPGAGSSGRGLAACAGAAPPAAPWDPPGCHQPPAGAAVSLGGQAGSLSPRVPAAALPLMMSSARLAPQLTPPCRLVMLHSQRSATAEGPAFFPPPQPLLVLTEPMGAWKFGGGTWHWAQGAGRTAALGRAGSAATSRTSSCPPASWPPSGRAAGDGKARPGLEGDERRPRSCGHPTPPAWARGRAGSRDVLVPARAAPRLCRAVPAAPCPPGSPLLPTPRHRAPGASLQIEDRAWISVPPPSCPIPADPLRPHPPAGAHRLQQARSHAVPSP